jgi:histidinol phosphatase-like enzyme
MAKKLNLSKFKKKYCFDLDGVICKTKKNYYTKSKPIKSSIKVINKLYDEGNYIFIYTSRFMGRSKENIKLANKKGYELTLNQLKKWKLKFHKLSMGKPSYDVIIDDKAVGFTPNWYKKL